LSKVKRRERSGMSPEPGVDRVAQCRRQPAICDGQLPWAMLLFLLPELASAALPRFGSGFQDHVVLQRGYPIEVWGLGATKDKELTVELVNDSGDVMASAKTRPWFDGKWNVIIPTLPEEATGQSFTLTVKNEGSEGVDQSLQDVT